MPATYAAFRAMVKGVGIRKAEDAPSRAKGLPLGCGLEAGAIPSLAELGVSGQPPSGKSFPGGETLVGGETEALRRMESFLKVARTLPRPLPRPPSPPPFPHQNSTGIHTTYVNIRPGFSQGYSHSNSLLSTASLL